MITTTVPTWTEGDTLPPLSGQCLSATTGVDGTTATAQVHISLNGVVITRTVTVDATGNWSMPWQTGDLVAGVGQVEVQLTFPGGGIETFGPNTILVNAQIA